MLDALGQLTGGFAAAMAGSATVWCTSRSNSPGYSAEIRHGARGISGGSARVARMERQRNPGPNRDRELAGIMRTREGWTRNRQSRIPLRFIRATVATAVPWQAPRCLLTAATTASNFAPR